MNSKTFYSKYIINSYFISNFNLFKLSQIPIIKHVKLKLLFTSINKINTINGVLAFSILTKTRPKLINSLKNYKENRVDISGITFLINKNKFTFLNDFVIDYIPDNMDSFVRLKKEPVFFDNISFFKFFDSIYVDKIYEISCLIRNSQQIKFNVLLKTNVEDLFYNTFLFNIFIGSKLLPKPL